MIGSASMISMPTAATCESRSRSIRPLDYIGDYFFRDAKSRPHGLRRFISPCLLRDLRPATLFAEYSKPALPWAVGIAPAHRGLALDHLQKRA